MSYNRNRKKNKQKGLIIFLLVLGVVLAVGLSGIYIMLKQTENVSAGSEAENTKQNVGNTPDSDNGEERTEDHIAEINESNIIYDSNGNVLGERISDDERAQHAKEKAEKEAQEKEQADQLAEYQAKIEELEAWQDDTHIVLRMPKEGTETSGNESSDGDEAKEDNEATLTFAGDMLFDSYYAVMGGIRRAGGITGAISGSLVNEMQNADFTMINNEFPYTTTGTPTEGKTYTFHADPSTVSYLNDLGVDAVSLANNHCYDYGEVGLLNTLDTLDGAGIQRIGAGHNLAEASAPYYYVAGNVKFAIIAASEIEQTANPDTKGATETSAGVFRCLDTKLLQQRIKEAKEQGAIVIVFIHWGHENTTELDYLQTTHVQEITQAGPDLIVGSHSHCLQKVDYVNGVPVFYSMGNFLFSSKTIDTGLLKVTLDTEGVKSLQFLPATQQNCNTIASEGTEKSRVLGYLQSLSGGVSIDENGFVTKR